MVYCVETSITNELRSIARDWQHAQANPDPYFKVCGGYTAHLSRIKTGWRNAVRRYVETMGTLPPEELLAEAPQELRIIVSDVIATA